MLGIEYAKWNNFSDLFSNMGPMVKDVIILNIHDTKSFICIIVQILI